MNYNNIMVATFGLAKCYDWIESLVCHIKFKGGLYIVCYYVVVVYTDILSLEVP